MKLIAKTAAITAAAAISATGLVGAIGSSATAATAAPNYTCTFTTQNGQYSLTIPITAAFPNVPLASGVAVPAGTPVSATLDLPHATDGAKATQLIADLGTALGGADGRVGGSVTFGPSNPVKVGDVPLSGTATAAPATLSDVAASGIKGVGALAAFTPLGSGAENVTLPASFTLVPTAVLSDGTPVPAGTLPNVPCVSTTGKPVVVGSVDVTPPLKATAKKIKAGHVAKIKVVTTPAQTGLAIAKIGKKKVAKATLKDGKATLKVKGLKKTTKVKVFVGSLKAVVKVKVKK
jgi:hypothetical protein